MSLAALERYYCVCRDDEARMMLSRNKYTTDEYSYSEYKEKNNKSQGKFCMM